MATQKNKIGKKTKPHRRLLRVLELDVIFTTYPLKYLLNICSSSVINLLEVLKEVPKSHVTRLSESKQNQYLPLSHLICRLIYLYKALEYIFNGFNLSKSTYSTWSKCHCSYSSFNAKLFRRNSYFFSFFNLYQLLTKREFYFSFSFSSR